MPRILPLLTPSTPLLGQKDEPEGFASSSRGSLRAQESPRTSWHQTNSLGASEASQLSKVLMQRVHQHFHQQLRHPGRSWRRLLHVPQKG